MTEYKGEGQKLLDSYSWFKNEKVIKEFLYSIDEIADFLPEEIEMLGIGSGVGILDYAVKKHLEAVHKKKVKLTIADKQVNDIIKSEGVTILEVDNKDLLFPDNKFDLVITRSVIHYEKNKENLEKVLSEIHRVLKSKGYFVNEALAFKSRDEMRLLTDIHALILKYVNLETVDEMIASHRKIFEKVELAQTQPTEPLSTERKFFVQRYELSDDVIPNQIIGMIEEYDGKNIPNIWVKEQDFGWSLHYTSVISQKVTV